MISSVFRNWLAEQLVLGKSSSFTDNYLCAIDEAFVSDEPPFLQESYSKTLQECALNPYWLIQSLISNSVKEGGGARDLWDFSKRIGDVSRAASVVKHAMDEARHAKLYVGLVSILFPNAVDCRQRILLLEECPTFKAGDWKRLPPYAERKVYDIFVQINLGEMRTRLHQLMLQPVLEGVCHRGRRRKLDALTASIAGDELAHLAYTAEIVGEWCDSEPLVAREMLRRRVRQFNELTTVELGTQDGQTF